MRVDSLLCVDRIEGDKVILLAMDGTVSVVPIGDLPDVKAGNVYRHTDGRYVRDAEAEIARKELVRLLQNRLR